jgi:hypothetical protein
LKHECARGIRNMARSNGQLPPQPGAGRTTRPDPQSWAQGSQPRPAAPQRAPQQQPQYAAPQSAGAAYQQAAYGTQAYGTQGHSTQGHATQAHGTQGGAANDPRYAPRPQADTRQPAPAQRPAASSSAFDSFVAQQPAPAASSYDVTTGGRQAGYGKSGAAAGYGSNGNGYAAPDYSRGAAPADQNGFTQWGNTPQPAADARGFDYGGYGGAAPGAANSAAAPYAQAGFGSGHFDHGASYGQDEWQGDGYGQEPSLDPALGQQAYVQDQHGAIEQSYEDDEYEDEPRSRRKLPLIAAAVAGALLCGGGLAYGYKTFLGPVASTSTPLIRGAEGPLKVKPDDPGGRKFANTESNVLGGSGNGANKIMGEPLADGATGGDNARKVQTVEVRPDGSVVPQSSMGDAPRAPAQASAMDFPTAGETGSVGRDGSSAPQVIAKAEPSPPSTARAAPPPAPEPEAYVDETPPASVAPPKKVAAKKVAPSAAPEGSMGPAPTGAGWVAVLASVPVSSSSQMDSLKQFADMQQKYGDVLGTKTPSVQEANLGEKGRYHRLVVGPPASRDSASSICGSLKTAGYTGCWVMQY